LTDWQTETNTYLAVVYTALIAEPVGVDKLVSELIEQAGLVVWWDDISRKIRLQVLREVPSTAAVFNQDNTMIGTLEVKEQPDKRVSQCYVYFAKINPLVKEDQLDNYRSAAFNTNAATESEYGTPSIKKIFSRWIPAGGRSIADKLTSLILGRFINPPRLLSFDVMRSSGITPALGTGYQIGGWPFQTMTGTAINVPAQITRLNPKADIFDIEAEEILFTSLGAAPTSPDVRTIIFDANINNVNLRTVFDSIYPAPVSGITVNVSIFANVQIGSTSTAIVAFDVGTWPAGVTINIVMSTSARIQGCGGNGGDASAGGNGGPGFGGGTALFTRKTINLTSTNGQIWGGGGGGGAGAGFGGGGGGGAGRNSGNGGIGQGGGANGSAGTTEAGGAGGPQPNPFQGGNGGTGGGPAIAGGAGANTPFGATGGAGGAAGVAIDGDSFVTDIGAPGDIRGSQIN